jgi:hypothetical protein
LKNFLQFPKKSPSAVDLRTTSPRARFPIKLVSIKRIRSLEVTFSFVDIASADVFSDKDVSRKQIRPVENELYTCCFPDPSPICSILAENILNSSLGWEYL